MNTLLQIEINEIAEIFLSNKKNRIGINEILHFLKYKDPISYRTLSMRKVKGEFLKLFPLYKNARKNTTCYKISNRQANKNRNESKLRLMPFKDINTQLYGIPKNYFTEI